VIQSGCGARSIALREPFNPQSNALRSAMESAFLTHFSSHPEYGGVRICNLQRDDRDGAEGVRKGDRRRASCPLILASVFAKASLNFLRKK